MEKTNDVDPEGGDPPCWAHLFAEEACPGEDQENDEDPASNAAAGEDPLGRGRPD